MKMTNQNSDTTNKVTSIDVRHEPDPNVSSDEYRFDQEFLQLHQEEPFFGTISMMLPKVADWKVDTAYVCADRQGNVKLGYNPDFMRGLISKHRKGVFKHELCHVLFMHIAERAVADRRRSRLWNVATDLAINSIIGDSNLPEFCLLPGRAPKTDDPKLADLIRNFPKMESADWYMARLEEYAEQNGNKNGEGEYTLEIGNGEGETLDSHGQWGEVPEEMRDIVRERIRELVEKGAKEAQRRGSWGSVPNEMIGAIEAMLRNELDWKAILRMFIGRARSIERQSTMKRINKRLPYLMPGAKRSTVANVLWAIDQSGSVSDSDVQRGLAEAFACSKEAQIDIVNFDTEIDMSSFKSIKNGQNFQWKRTRCGGTDFDCVQKFLNDPKNRGKYSAVIMFTDGYAPKMGAIVGTRVLWVITEHGDAGAPRPGDLVVKMGKEDKSVKRA
jgi:predicted metal-dependent peptidase